MHRDSATKCRAASRRFGVAGFCAAMLFLCSCGAPASNDVAQLRPIGGSDAASAVRRVANRAGSVKCVGSDAIAQLWSARTSGLGGSDYPIGPGDLIKISVVGVQQLEDQEVRVSGDGRITMPFVGSFPVTDMTQDELLHTITDKLKVYIKDPRVSVFVQRYASRTVTIMGLVEKPGRYVLVSPSESIIQVLGEAGGTTVDSSDRILFVPAESRFLSADDPAEPAGCTVALNEASDRLPVKSANDPCLQRANYGSHLALGQLESHAIEVDLSNPADRACLSLPARPGDLVIVPQAGEVEVAGWVQKPGSVRVRPGMTVLGAVSAAGGAIFSNDVELLRTDPDGRRTQTSLNLADIQEGRSADIPVESGEVIYVGGSAMAVVSYTAEQLFAHFGTGMMVPIP